jgi:hypothetical protein
MDPISNANRIAMLLRQRLQDRSKSAAPERSGAGGSGQTMRRGALRNVNVVDQLDDRKLKRALIENILADEFGTELINDARFQQVVSQVTDVLDGDTEGGPLLAEVIADLRARHR